MNYVKLEDICNITTGKYDANHGENGGDYHFYTCAIEPIKCPTFSFEGECIILPGNGANVGEVLYHNGKFEAYQRTYVLQNLHANPRFVYYQLKSRWKKYISNKQYGSATNYIRYNNIAEFQIPMLSLEEQKKIAQILDKADEIRTKKRLANAKLDEFLKSTFIDMFGDPVTNEKNWNTDILNNVAPIKSYSGEVEKIDGKFWLLNLDVVESNTGKILEYNYEASIPNSTCCFNSDMVLYSKLRPYLNKVVLPNKTGYATSELVPLNPVKEKLNKYFLASLLRSKCFVDDINVRVAGAKMPRVSMDYLRNFPIILPPIEDQNKFAQIVEKVEEQKQKNEQVIEQMDNLFNSLSQRAFKGEL